MYLTFDTELPHAGMPNDPSDENAQGYSQLLTQVLWRATTKVSVAPQASTCILWTCVHWGRVADDAHA